MTKGRIEAFTDGVVAIIITIMVLELKVPEGHDLAALRPLLPTFLAYVLSFANVGLYWNNHHHMFHAVTHVRGWVLWANLHLLFWLSLIPFTTAYLAESGITTQPVALYCFDLLMCGAAYGLLEQTLIAAQGKGSDFRRKLGKTWKDNGSLVIYTASLALAFVMPILSIAGVIAVALMWIVPDRRFERE